MICEALMVFVVPALLSASAGWDLTSFTIPNWIPFALGGAFLVFAVAAGLAPAAVGLHLLAGLLGLALGFALFAFGFIGGGDAKLFAGVALWLGFGDLPEYALVASLFGGGLTLALIGLRELPLPAGLLGHQWISRLHDRRSGVPYGVALAAGALIVLPHTELFRLAAG